MASTNILRFFKRKIADNYEEPIYLGAEQRFITALRGSNHNNLEEQFLLDVDKIVVSQWLGTTLKETTEFHDGTKTNGYYILESSHYGAAADSQWMYDGIQFAYEFITFQKPDPVLQEQYGNVLEIKSNEADFTDNNTTLSVRQKFEKDDTPDSELDSEGFRKVKDEILYYKNSKDELITVSTKTIKEKEENGITTTKSVIKSSL